MNETDRYYLLYDPIDKDYLIIDRVTTGTTNWYDTVLEVIIDGITQVYCDELIRFETGDFLCILKSPIPITLELIQQSNPELLI